MNAGPMITPSWAWGGGDTMKLPSPVVIEEKTKTNEKGGGCKWVRWLLLGFVVGMLWFFFRPYESYRSSLTMDFEDYTRSVG
jgi:hypothetical protein